MVEILVVRAGSLGDFVLTLPVIEALRARGETVDVACNPRFAPLLGGLERDLLDIGGPAMSWAFGGVAPRPWSRAYAFSAAMAEGLCAAGIGDVRWVEPPTDGPRRNAAGSAWEHLGGVLRGEPFGLPTIRAGGQEPLHVVVIAPGSGGARKRKPIAFWADVDHALTLAGVPTRWIAGPDEAGEAWTRPTESPDLRGLVRLAAQCRAWVGPDAGPQHLAAAARRGAGRPPGDVHVVFGPTNPAIWSPPGSTVHPWDIDPRVLAARLTTP
jgi:ADP-heptose:LPS heptosyltransferase